MLLVAIGRVGRLPGRGSGYVSATPAVLLGMMTPRRALGCRDRGLGLCGGRLEWRCNPVGIGRSANPHNGQWHTGPALQMPRSQHALFAADDQLWVVGGWSAESGLVSAVERMSLDDPAGEFFRADGHPSAHAAPGTGRCPVGKRRSLWPVVLMAAAMPIWMGIAIVSKVMIWRAVNGGDWLPCSIATAGLSTGDC